MGGGLVRVGSPPRIARANKVLAYGVASVSGTILAVCSCTVLPLFAGIYRMGAGLGPATAFLYSGPAINVLAIILTARIPGLELGIARAALPLIAALEDGEYLVRARAAEALRKIGDERAVNPLAAALKDENKGVRVSVAIALGVIGDARAVEALVAALEDEEHLVRARAAEALGKIGDSRAALPLTAALKDEDEWVRTSAAEALKKLNAP